jgi:hypothetical protein
LSLGLHASLSLRIALPLQSNRPRIGFDYRHRHTFPPNQLRGLVAALNNRGLRSAWHNSTGATCLARHQARMHQAGMRYSHHHPRTDVSITSGAPVYLASW